MVWLRRSIRFMISGIVKERCETRRPKAERRPKTEGRKTESAATQGFSDFGFRSSDFGFSLATLCVMVACMVRPSTAQAEEQLWHIENGFRWSNLERSEEHTS